MEYVMIDYIPYPINTLDEIIEAKRVMREEGLESVPVWYIPGIYVTHWRDGNHLGYGIPKVLFAE